MAIFLPFIWFHFAGSITKANPDLVAREEKRNLSLLSENLIFRTVIEGQLAIHKT